MNENKSLLYLNDLSPRSPQFADVDDPSTAPLIIINSRGSYKNVNTGEVISNENTNSLPRPFSTNSKVRKSATPQTQAVDRGILRSNEAAADSGLPPINDTKPSWQDVSRDKNWSERAKYHAEIVFGLITDAMTAQGLDTETQRLKNIAHLSTTLYVEKMLPALDCVPQVKANALENVFILFVSVLGKNDILSIPNSDHNLIQYEKTLDSWINLMTSHMKIEAEKRVMLEYQIEIYGQAKNPACPDLPDGLSQDSTGVRDTTVNVYGEDSIVVEPSFILVADTASLAMGKYSGSEYLGNQSAGLRMAIETYVRRGDTDGLINFVVEWFIDIDIKISNENNFIKATTAILIIPLGGDRWISFAVGDSKLKVVTPAGSGGLPIGSKGHVLDVLPTQESVMAENSLPVGALTGGFGFNAVGQDTVMIRDFQLPQGARIVLSSDCLDRVTDIQYLATSTPQELANLAKKDDISIVVINHPDT